jgi:hypothetical protein
VTSTSAPRLVLAGRFHDGLLMGMLAGELRCGM